MPNGGCLRIAASNLSCQETDLSGDFVAVSVSDTGVGMTSEVLEKAFDPFFTTKAEHKGTGLGLSQVHGFARQSGGDARAASVAGKGCTVTLRLPRASRPVAPVESPSIQAEPLQRASGSVLLVEDNPSVAETTSALLKALGYRVVHESNAADAIGRLDAGEPIDVVLSDIVMPGPFDGVGLARRLRGSHARLPVVLTTGYSDATDAAADAVAILRKPFSAQSLASALAGALTGSRQGAQPGP
jgi:CheY-like chemotaxis protein